MKGLPLACRQLTPNKNIFIWISMTPGATPVGNLGLLFEQESRVGVLGPCNSFQSQRLSGPKQMGSTGFKRSNCALASAHNLNTNLPITHDIIQTLKKLSLKKPCRSPPHPTPNTGVHDHSAAPKICGLIIFALQDLRGWLVTFGPGAKKQRASSFLGLDP